MLALELVKDRETKEPAADEAKALVQVCLAKGLVILACGTFGNVIRFLMPLNIGAKDCGQFPLGALFCDEITSEKQRPP